MASIVPPPGIMSDQPRFDHKPFYAQGVNIRFRMGLPETVGLTGPIRTLAGDPLQLPGVFPYRSLLNSQSQSAAQIMGGSADRVAVISFDPGSLPATGRRYQVADITPANFSTSDDLPDPDTGAVFIPPNVAFAPQEDVVVMIKANDATKPVWYWDRDIANTAQVLNNAPPGAVGLAIANRVLVLIGAQSFTHPDPERYLTVRWSDRNNFEDWTPTDINESGELQLSDESGSRLIGGGLTRFGVACFTNAALHILTETFDINSVFDPQIIDGSGGLMSNQAWCEMDGSLWYFDPARNLRVYDGGAARTIPNPLKMSTVERMCDCNLARASLNANPEFSEIILNYVIAGDDEPNRQLIYNVAENAWSISAFQRGAWSQRVGTVETLAVTQDNMVKRHDINTGYGIDFTYPPNVALPDPLPPPAAPPVADVDPFSFYLFTNAITGDPMTNETLRTTRMHWSYIHSSADGAGGDLLTFHVTGYGLSDIPNADQTHDAVTVPVGQGAVPIRVSGKGLVYGISGTDIRTFLRIAGPTPTLGEGASR